jgi:hypothetical protein
MIPARERRERMIRGFGDRAARHAFEAVIWRAVRAKPCGFLDFLDDETVEAIARDLATDYRSTQRHNRRERARAAERARVPA